VIGCSLSLILKQALFMKFRSLVAAVSVCLIASVGCASTNSELLIGNTTTDALFQSVDKFNRNYQAFEPTFADKKRVEGWPRNLHIDLYFGTWCHDSEREVPKLLKLAALSPQTNINLVALDYNKQEPKGRAEQQGVKYTPTIIVYLHNKEIGRIVERPKDSITEDIEAMLAKYTNK
jgi:thioredoxin 1